MKRTLLSLAILALSSLPAYAADAPQAAEDEAAIRKTVDAYVAAFNRGDADALAACWCEDGEFISPAGDVIRGRQALREAFEAFLKDNSEAKLEVAIASVRIEGPNAAVEEGDSRVTIPNEPVTETSYVAQYVKQDGKWLLKSLREVDKAPSHYEQLKELEWLIGEWVDTSEGSTVQTTCRWTKNRNFISRSFAVSIGDQIDFEGTQVIGWDPAEEVIRSWLFDSDGGFGAGVWSQKGDRWTIHALRVLPDGRKASSINVLTRADEDSFTWESTGREVDGEILPNVGPVTVIRKAPSN
jgi:uncharacterized protein (TIGR02246 family)